jgi:hypothetical protein
MINLDKWENAIRVIQLLETLPHGARALESSPHDSEPEYCKVIRHCEGYSSLMANMFDIYLAGLCNFVPKGVSVEIKITKSVHTKVEIS